MVKTVPPEVQRAAKLARDIETKMWQCLKAMRSARLETIKLAQKHGLGMRQIGQLLGLSAQRVGQFIWRFGK